MFKSRLWLDHSRTFRDLSQSRCPAGRWTSAPVWGPERYGAYFHQGSLYFAPFIFPQSWLFSQPKWGLGKTPQWAPTVLGKWHWFYHWKTSPRNDAAATTMLHCRSVPRHNPVSELYGQFLRPHGSRMINGNTMHPRSILSLIAKGLNTDVNKVFLFSVFNSICKMS